MKMVKHRTSQNMHQLISIFSIFFLKLRIMLVYRRSWRS